MSKQISLGLALLWVSTAQAQQNPHAHHEHHAPAADQPTPSESAHVPPPPPEFEMHDMSAKDMVEMMEMDDNARFGMALLDQLEWRDTDAGDVLAWDGRLWYGNDYDKVLLKSEGGRSDAATEGSAELLWDHVLSRWWTLQGGVAHDFGEGPSRTWAAFGVQGLAPYWFEVEATLYAGEQGRTALSFSGEYDLFVSQRLILQPKLEFNLYGKDDAANGIGSGLSNAELGLRLRYEIRRELAPYVGLSWSRSFGETADLRGESSELSFVAGLRMWF